MDEKKQQQQQQPLRDRSELEGALLATDVVAIPYHYYDPFGAYNAVVTPPLAYATLAPSAAGIATTATTTTTTTTRPVVHSYRSGGGDDSDDKEGKNNDDDEYLVQDAVVLAPAYSTPNDDALERRITKEATLRGRIQAEQELEEIQRNNRKVHAINYFQRMQVEEANRKAAIQNFREETGQTQTSCTIPVEKSVPGPPRKEPEFYPGTYGKEYETSEYDTKEYQGTEYETTEYKSVYDP